MTMESRQPEGTGSNSDLVRSAAPSSADLWHEILERLNEVQEGQLKLARAIESLGMIVCEALSVNPAALGGGEATSLARPAPRVPLAAGPPVESTDGRDPAAARQAIDSLLASDVFVPATTTPAVEPPPDVAAAASVTSPRFYVAPVTPEDKPAERQPVGSGSWPRGRRVARGLGREAPVVPTPAVVPNLTPAAVDALLAAEFGDTPATAGPSRRVVHAAEGGALLTSLLGGEFDTSAPVSTPAPSTPSPTGGPTAAPTTAPSPTRAGPAPAPPSARPMAPTPPPPPPPSMPTTRPPQPMPSSPRPAAPAPPSTTWSPTVDPRRSVRTPPPAAGAPSPPPPPSVAPRPTPVAGGPLLPPPVTSAPSPSPAPRAPSVGPNPSVPPGPVTAPKPTAAPGPPAGGPNPAPAPNAGVAAPAPPEPRRAPLAPVTSNPAPFGSPAPAGSTPPPSDLPPFSATGATPEAVDPSTTRGDSAASMATEIRSASPRAATVEPAETTPTMLAEDVTIMAKGRRRRFRLR
jgi:hypothetical protein